MTDKWQTSITDIQVESETLMQLVVKTRAEVLNKTGSDAEDPDLVTEYSTYISIVEKRKALVEA